VSLRCGGALLGLLLAACAGSPPPPAPGEAALFGQVRLVPHAGAPDPQQASAYGDRRLEDVRLVDYSRPGFVVLYLEPGTPPRGDAALAIVEGRLRPRLEPAYAALGAGGAVLVTNQSGAPQVLSCPRAELVARLAPGESARIEAREPGELRIHLVDAGGESATVFVAPGPYALADAVGGFAFAGLAPGRFTLRAWHPRLPPAARELALAPGEARRVDIEIGVGLAEQPHATR
jgi:hypothetical protein